MNDAALPPMEPNGAPIAILDTNALLDWRVFKDPAALPVAEALAAGTLRWLATPAMETEWHHVWPRSAFARWQPDPAWTTTVFAHAEMVAEPPRGPLRCKDPDDQVFIDLALHVGATWLFTKDAALLKLASRARKRTGLEVLSLQDWVGRHGACLRPGMAPVVTSSTV
ncbi:MAG: putative toxin-antitoxin system toxin component, PIN family [Aquabacterium sp.]